MKKSKIIFPLILMIFILNFLLNRINVDSNMIESLLNKSNAHFASANQSNISNVLFDLLNIELKEPVSILESNMVFNNVKQPMYIYMNNQNIVDNPIVYLYNSHPTEYYKDTEITEYGLRPGVLTATYVLQEKLNEIGINTIVEERNVYNYLLEHDLTYNDSYEVSREYVKEAILKYPDLKLIIDIHRDAIPENVAITNIEENEYSRIMFVMSTGYQKNYDKAIKFNNIIENKYPTLTRGIYDKTYHFNQDLSSDVMLLELGGDKNSYEQVLNTVELLVPLIGEYLNEG